MTPWKALCVDLIGPYTLKGQDGSSNDFMCLTMINADWQKIGEHRQRLTDNNNARENEG
jgi:hypothetical protein